LDRSADIVWLDLPEGAASFPRFSVFGLSLAGTTSEGSSRALWSWTDSNDLGFREFKEMRVLAASRHDAPVFHMRDKQVSSLDDLKGAKIAIPTSGAETFVSGLGASPVVMPGPAMREALADSTVDGVLLSWASLSALKLEEMVKVHAGAPPGAPWAYAELSVLLMNPDAYRSMADDLKQVIRANSGSDTSAWIGNSFDESAAASRARAAARGDLVIDLPDTDRETWRQAAGAALDERIQELDSGRLKGKKMISRARALIDEYDKPK
jgi:TRAP-type C4-dicarboxylate transport system substrate-binding protein